jgi:hypothetical protein
MSFGSTPANPSNIIHCCNTPLPLTQNAKASLGLHDYPAALAQLNAINHRSGDLRPAGAATRFTLASFVKRRKRLNLVSRCGAAAKSAVGSAQFVATDESTDKWEWRSASK